MAPPADGADNARGIYFDAVCRFVVFSIIKAVQTVFSIVYIMYIVFIMFVYSSVGYELLTQSEATRDAAYNCHWYNLTPRQAIQVIPMLLQSQKPLKITAGKFVPLTLTTFASDWAFLARFCFLSEKGRFAYDLKINGNASEDSSVNLLLYYDAPDQWPIVYPSHLSCADKLSILSVDRGQIVPLWKIRGVPVAGCKLSNETGVKLRCKSHREFRSARPRWWFMALADCSSTKGLNVTYWISLTNARPGSFWREHFSADEFYILPELIATGCAYVVMLGLSLYSASQLRSRRLLHVSYKIFVISVTCQLMGILCETGSLTKYAISGIEETTFSVIGGILESYSETLYTVLMLLLALGYTVTKSQLTQRQILGLFAFVGITLLLQMALFIYQSEVFDPGLVLYIYESPPGYCLLSIKIGTWLVFVMCCYRTSRKTPSKFLFYASLMSLGSTWFLCHPITVWAITLIIEKWARESVVKGCSLWIVFLGHAMFLWVTRPSSANTRFPFHIRTCQVVPVQMAQNHSYEPQSRSTAALFTLTQFNSNGTTAPR